MFFVDALTGGGWLERERESSYARVCVYVRGCGNTCAHAHTHTNAQTPQAALCRQDHRAIPRRCDRGHEGAHDTRQQTYQQTRLLHARVEYTCTFDLPVRLIHVYLTDTGHCYPTGRRDRRSAGVPSPPRKNILCLVCTADAVAVVSACESACACACSCACARVFAWIGARVCLCSNEPGELTRWQTFMHAHRRTCLPKSALPFTSA